MMKRYFFFGFFILSHFAFSQARDNWFPNRGNVGIGTRTPTKDLEVIGDIKATNTIYSNSLESGSIVGGTLNLSNNAMINGRLGIGVTNPTEKLEVLGNFKLQGNLTALGLTIQSLQTNSGLFNTLTVNQNASFHGLVTFGENVSFSKDALVAGKLGIGISAPSEALDVLGNIKSSAGLFSSSLTTGTAQLASLNVAQNSIFNGLVGIGVPSPEEKLHIGGNLKVRDGIFSRTLTTTNFQTGVLTATGLASFSENATFGKDLILNGKLGIGITTPSESLDISGNLKLTGGINAATLTANQGSFAQGLSAGNTTVNGRLDVTGILNAQSVVLSNLNTTNNVTVGKDLSVSGNSNLTGTLQVGGQLSSQAISASAVTTSGDINSGQNLSVSGSTTLNNLLVNGQMTSKNFAVEGVNATGNVSVGQNLAVTGASTLNALQVSGQLTSQAISATRITTTGNATIGQGITVNGISQLNGDINVTGNSTIGGNLSVTGTLNAGSIAINDINTNGNATITQNLTVSGLSQLGGDVNVGGNLKAGVIEATEFRKSDGSALFNLDNATITQTLKVATDRVPDNYKLAVGGNIIATGIDIKIPQKWPDYVFTDGHKLLTIAEVDQYIKANRHLPGILSAEEMKAKENYSVSEMDAKLLEKIEEMMLYIIELKKEIESLKK